jgi:hypothetical protein
LAFPRSAGEEWLRGPGHLAVFSGGLSPGWPACGQGGPCAHRHGAWDLNVGGAVSNKTWPEQFSGTDPLGDYNGTLWHWQTGSIRLETSIRQYASAVVFSLAYPDGATGTDARFNTTTHSAVPSANFPAFSGANNATARPGSLGYLSWHGNMCNHTNTMQLASVSDGGQDTGGPVVLYDRCNESVVVISALNNFMTAQSTVNQPGLPSRNGKHEMIFGAETSFLHRLYT